MKTFLAIYTGTEAALEKSGWKHLDDATRKRREAEGIEGWTAWGRANAAAIVEQGSPLGTTRRVSADGIATIKNAMTGYVIVRAESHEAAARLFERHPHFTIFPGEAVELMERLPLPGG